MRRRWLAVVVALVIAAVVGWVVAGDWDGKGQEKHAAAPGRPRSAPSSSIPSARPIPTGSFNAAANNILNPSTKTGGTLRLLSGVDCDSWDPGRVTFSWCFNLQRLITRTLVGYSVVDGSHFRLAPDLASSLGEHNADFTKWTYTLKPGLSFSTGRPISPLDVKYGIERLFATVKMYNDTPSVYLVGSTPQPASYFIDSLTHPRSYRGPYQSGDLPTITTTADSITFRLSHPNADFDYLMALPAAAPVPYRVEGGKGYRGQDYESHPVASGPYKIGSYRPNKLIVFVRNRQWLQNSDGIRHPRVDTVRLRIDDKPYDIDRQLASGRADASADGGVLDRFRKKILRSPELKQRVDDPVGDVTRYLAVMPSVVPNVHCRRAIFYALDKAEAVRVFGGPTAAVPAASMTPPGIDGYTAGFDPYPSGPNWTGDLAKARSELRACGKPHGFDVVLLYPVPGVSDVRFYMVEDRALRRVGINLHVSGGLPGLYGNPGDRSYLRRQHGLALAAWQPAFPTGFGFYRHFDLPYRYLPNFDGDVRTLGDPTITRVLHAASHGQATDADWRRLDHVVMASAEYLPFAFAKTLYYRNPRMTNVTCDNALANGIYDFVNIGVR